MAGLKLTNWYEFQKFLNKNTSNLASASFYSLFKPFSTNIRGTGTLPNYQSGIKSDIIDAIDLIPFGANTVNQGINYGNTVSTDLNDPESIDREKLNIRSIGLKTPFTHVGWGYDIFGYPAPNAELSWTVSGQYNKFDIAPSKNFLNELSSTKGSDVPESFFLAGPQDLRWDNIRKVWTSQLPVYPAVISAVDIADGSASSEPNYPSGIRYSARIFDGVSSGITVTGLRPANRSPLDDTYKVYPARINDPCFIISTPKDGDLTRPILSIWVNEIPYAEQCSSNNSTEISRSTNESAGNLTLFDLADDPLDANYGGTSYNSFNPGEILVGTNAFGLGKYTLQAGSGITLTTNYAVATGVVKISLSSGIAFVESGYNTSITQLAGLTTPLSIAQGGTGGSGLVFVDVSGNQSISGIKSFYTQVNIPFGSPAMPGLSFNGIAAGLTYHPNSGVGVTQNGYNLFNWRQAEAQSSVPVYINQTVSGTGTSYLTISNAYSKNFIEFRTGSGLTSFIDNFGYFGGYGIAVTGIASGIPITIGGTATHTQPYLQITRATGIKVFNIDSTGITFFRNNQAANLIPTHTGQINLYLPERGGTLALSGINYGPSKYTTTLSSGNSLYNVAHNLNTRYAITSVFEALSPYEVVYPTIKMSGLNNLTIDFGVNTTINYEVTVIG